MESLIPWGDCILLLGLAFAIGIAQHRVSKNNHNHTEDL